MSPATLRRWFSLAVSTGAIALAACAETPNVDRRLAYVNQHGELSAERREAISDGHVIVGMTMDEVRATVGEPMHVTKSDRREADGPVHAEVWIYPGPVVHPSVMRSSQDSEFMVRLRFENGVLREIREI